MNAKLTEYYDYGVRHMVNADGLTSVGQMLFSKLMEKHFIVDQEHGSYETKVTFFGCQLLMGIIPSSLRIRIRWD